MSARTGGSDETNKHVRSAGQRTFQEAAGSHLAVRPWAVQQMRRFGGNIKPAAGQFVGESDCLPQSAGGLAGMKLAPEILFEARCEAAECLTGKTEVE